MVAVTVQEVVQVVATVQEVVQVVATVQEVVQVVVTVQEVVQVVATVQEVTEVAVQEVTEVVALPLLPFHPLCALQLTTPVGRQMPFRPWRSCLVAPQRWPRLPRH
jgi:hypothetical protein